MVNRHNETRRLARLTALAAWCLGLVGVAAITLLTGTARAAPITVNNHSFQSQTLTNDAVNPSLVSWAGGAFGTNNGRATWNPPGSNAPDNLAYGFIDASGNGTPLGADGSNVFTIFGGDASSGATIYQDSATLLASGTAYTMSVAVGRRANGDASNWTFGLMANNQSFSGGQFATNQYLAYASGSAAELTSGRFLDKTLSITLESGNAAIGRNLRVVLSARGGGTGSTTSTAYDNVRLFQSEGSMAASTTQPLGTVGVSSGVSLTFAETASFNTAISGAGGVRVNAGTVTLGGVNTYTGATSVTAGTLVVNGSLAAGSAVSVGANGTLGGTGTINGATTILGAHTPGNSPGIQSFASNLTYSGGSSTVQWELIGNTITNAANPNAVYDQILVGGNLDFAGATSLSLLFSGAGSSVLWADPFWDGPQQWTLYDVAGSTTGFENLSLAPGSYLDSGSNSLVSVRPNASFSVVQSENDVVISYVAVPEPVGLTLLASAAIAGWTVAQRRRAAS